MQELLSSDVTDEGLRALSTSNRNTVKLLLTPPDKQRQIIAEAVKQSDTFFDKVWLTVTIEHQIIIYSVDCGF